MGGHEPSPAIQKMLDERAAEHFGFPIYDEVSEFVETGKLREPDVVEEPTYWDEIAMPLTNNLSHQRQRRMARAQRNGGNMISVMKHRGKR